MNYLHMSTKTIVKHGASGDCSLFLLAKAGFTCRKLTLLKENEN